MTTEKLQNTEDYDDSADKIMRSVPLDSMTQKVEMDTGITVTFYGYKENPQKQLFFMIFSVLTAGIVYLVSLWSLRLKLIWTMDRCALSQASWIYAKNDENAEDLRRIKVSKEKNLKYFIYRYVRFIFDDESKKFIICDVVEMIRNDFPTQGLTAAVVKERRVLVGENSFEVENKSCFAILADGILHPFNVFQVFASIVWFKQDQGPYATAILLMSGYGIITTLLETRKSLRHLRDMAYFSCPVNILRDGQWISGVPSEALVPGDIFELDCDMEILPCDALLISGEVLLNESMLTGESIPVVRKSIPADETLADNLDNKASILYAGTKLMRVRGGNSRRALAMVIRTSFDTFKGFLLRQIIYTHP